MNVSSARKHPGRLCQTIESSSIVGSHFHMLSIYPQRYISRLSFFNLCNCRKNILHEHWLVCPYDTNFPEYDCMVCVWACEAWLNCCINRRKFHSHQTQLTRQRICLSNQQCRLYDNLGDYFTDPCNHNCLSNISAGNAWNLKITLWDNRYDTCKHSCDFMIRPREW